MSLVEEALKSWSNSCNAAQVTVHSPPLGMGLNCLSVKYYQDNVLSEVTVLNVRMYKCVVGRDGADFLLLYSAVTNDYSSV